MQDVGVDPARIVDDVPDRARVEGGHRRESAGALPAVAEDPGHVGAVLRAKPGRIEVKERAIEAHRILSAFLVRARSGGPARASA